MSEQSSMFPALTRRAFVGTSAVVGASLFLPLATPLRAHAVTAAEKQAEANAALEKLNALQEKLNLASDNYYTALSDQQAAQGRMDEAQGRIDEASSRISDLQGQLGQRARSMYRSGSLTFLDLLLGSTSFQAFASNWDLLNDMNENDAEMVEETKTLREEVTAEKAVYEEQRNVAAQKAQEAEDTKQEAEGLVQQTRDVYDSLSAEAAQLVAEEQAAREAAALEAALKAEEEMRQQAAAEEAGGNDNAGNDSGNGDDGGNGGNSNGGGGGWNSGSSSSSSSSSSGSSSSRPSSSNNSRPQTVTGNVVVDRAYSQCGKPYIWAAAGPEGFDCSGLVGYCLTGTMGNHWCTTYTIAAWPAVTNPQPGDICIDWGHTGIYIGGGQMIHAPTEGDVVKVGPVQAGMWYVRY